MLLVGLTMENHSTEEQSQIGEIVQDFFRYQLNKRGLRWTPQGSAGTSHENLGFCLAMRSLGDEFLAKYRDNVVTMVDRLELANSQVESAYVAVLDEMFSEGVLWSRIVVAFVFSVEFAYQLAEKRFGEGGVEQTCEWLQNYIAQKILPWIRTHSGWAGLIQFNEEHSNQEDGSVWPFFKNAFCGVAGVALGALALGAFLTSKS